jgi:hypothetical protein
MFAHDVSPSSGTANEDQQQASSSPIFFFPEHKPSPPSSQPSQPHHTLSCSPARPPPNNNNNNKTINNMPPRNPNTMPEFKLIDGWHVAVSQPVHNPAGAAVERHFAAVASASTSRGEMQYYSSPAGPAPAVSTRALGVEKASTAAVERDGSVVVRNGYACHG